MTDRGAVGKRFRWAWADLADESFSPPSLLGWVQWDLKRWNSAGSNFCVLPFRSLGGSHKIWAIHRHSWLFSGSDALALRRRHQKISANLLDDLTLLTLGPMLRGSANVRKGSAGIRTVFNAINEIVEAAVTSLSNSQITILNAAGRTVLIEFAADPDIIIREEMRTGQYRQLIAIEVKAGSDFSNIHNRIGEAEKSHQKAKSGGYVECWTVVNVDRTDITTAHRESPSTNRFYRTSDIVGAEGDDYLDFRDRVISLTGIVSA